MSDRPEDILDSALMIAISRGIPVTGWHVQREEDGYSAWLYVDSPDGIYSESLHTQGEIEVSETLMGAAMQCLELAGGLVSSVRGEDVS